MNIEPGKLKHLFPTKKIYNFDHRNDCTNDNCENGYTGTLFKTNKGDNTKKQLDVTSAKGPEVENMTVVERGLRPNEIIVVEGQHKLSHGNRVEAIPYEYGK